MNEKSAKPPVSTKNPSKPKQQDRPNGPLMYNGWVHNRDEKPINLR